jgi:hypothetical protein
MGTDEVLNCCLIFRISYNQSPILLLFSYFPFSNFINAVASGGSTVFGKSENLEDLLDIIV